MNGEWFFTTRPRLLTRCMESGIKWELTENFYNPQRPAWKIQITPESKRIVNDFYQEIGKKKPFKE